MATKLRPENRLRPPHGAGRNRRPRRPGPRPELDELLLIYRVQFPVMQGYERDTWYDMAGRIIFTNSKGLVGVGLQRKGSSKSADVTTTTTIPDGKGGQISKTGKFGWDDLRQMQEAGTLPAGSTVTTTVIDDTQPGRPQTRMPSYTAPFALANGVVWEFFANKNTGGRSFMNEKTSIATEFSHPEQVSGTHHILRKSVARSSHLQRIRL